MNISQFAYHCLLMNIWIVSNFELIERTAWTTPLYGHTLSFLLGKYPGGECLDGMVGVCLTFQETARLFSKVATPSYRPTRDV